MNLQMTMNALLEIKRVQIIAQQCKSEMAAQGFSKSDVDRWDELLGEISSHISKIEISISKRPFHEDDVSREIVWIRSLSRKLDYFKSENVESWTTLQNSVEKLFSITIP